MNSHQIHARNCGIVKRALEKSGYKCEAASPPIKGVAFIVTPPNGGKKFKVQVRSRLYLIEKYCGKQMRIAFPEEKNGKRFVYLYQLDAMVREFIKRRKEQGDPIPKSWDPRGVYHIKPTPDWALKSSVLHRIAPRT